MNDTAEPAINAALAAFERAITVDPSNAQAWHNRAEVLSRLVRATDERQRDRERQNQRASQPARQPESQTDRQTAREPESQTDRQTDRPMHDCRLISDCGYRAHRAARMRRQLPEQKHPSLGRLINLPTQPSY